LRFLKVACLLLLVSCASQPTDDAPAKTDQTASIEGTVREAGSDIPVAGVSVFLVRTSDQLQIRATTDNEGRFTLQGLNAGRHLVALVREGYVVPGRQEISGYPYRVTEGERVQNAVFRMIPAGTIAGRVFREDGTPANRVEIQLLQQLYVMGQPQWSVVNRGQDLPSWLALDSTRVAVLTLGMALEGGAPSTPKLPQAEVEENLGR